MNDDQIARYVSEHAPELDPEEVAAFIRDNAQPTSESGTPIEWALRTLRELSEGETHNDRLSVDRVADELRRHNP